MKKKQKNILILGLVILGLILCISRLKIQSVSDYQKQQKTIAKDLQIREVKTDKNSGSASVKETTDKKKDSRNKSSSPKKKKKIKKDKKESSSNKSAKKDTNKHTNKDTNKKNNKKANRKKDASKGKTASKEKKHHSKDTSNEQSQQDRDDEDSSSKKEIHCTISIICPALSEDPSVMREAYRSYIPESGVLLSSSSVTLREGSSVFDLLKAVCQAKDIALDAEYSTLYSGSYIRGIGHLYERQAGDMSGWLYKVNGVIPQKGASNYILKDNDNVVWGYTTNGRGM